MLLLTSSCSLCARLRACLRACVLPLCILSVRVNLFSRLANTLETRYEHYIIGHSKTVLFNSYSE
jgi:hypothetical protein